MSENTSNNTDITYGKSESDIEKIIAFVIRADREWSCVLIREELSGFVNSEELDALIDRICNAPIGDE